MSPNEVYSFIEALDSGKIRVCEKNGEGEWRVNLEAKQAILEYFQLENVRPLSAGELQFFDKIPVKKWSLDQRVRVVPPAIVRYGAFVAPQCVLMPSFVNIGAYVDSGTMVDTWATVGSCAQIGKNVHLSGGVGIGGVLEPVQAQPVIIEDHVFIGSRCVVVEGVRVEQGAVLGAGVVLTQSTRIIDVTEKTEKVIRGVIPAYSVVIPGTVQKNFPAGSCGVPCALIIGKRNDSTDKKTSLNEVLRAFSVPV